MEEKEEEIIVISRYETIINAEYAKELLEESGISSFLKDENITQLYPMFNSPFGGIKLCIMKKDEKQALEILHNNNLIHS